MNIETGEIRKDNPMALAELFSKDSNWRPLSLKKGDIIVLNGFRFEILAIAIKVGKPGRMNLKLRGLGRKEDGK